MTSRRWIPLTIILLLLPQLALADGIVHRFVLAAGVNSGGSSRIPLQYAISDANKFANVMVMMGGVAPADRVVLDEPDLGAFERALGDLQRSVAAAQAAAGRTEVMLYYSGHADETGLLIGTEHLRYEELRQRLDEIPADVRIAVLDACASGAITRMKGGQRRPAFLVDDSSDTEGYAFLTSSSADEAAQESDRIGASFFTHYLVSGMHGAADVSGEGKVTLGEAYQFAFNETLARTTETQGGAQHPAYHFNLSGTGDVVMTDVRETSAGLLLAEELSGRFFVRSTADEQLVAELFKPAGRTIELGLEPGSYDIFLEQTEHLYLATSELASGDRLVLTPRQFDLSAREETVARGGPHYRYPGIHPASVYGMTGRSAIGIAVGSWSTRPQDTDADGGIVSVRFSAADILAGVHFTHWPSEMVAFSLSVTNLTSTVSTNVGFEVETAAVDVSTVMIEGRRYLEVASPPGAFRPYLSGAAGVFVGTTSRETVGTQVVVETGVETAFGGRLGGGTDVLLGRHFMVNASAGYNLVSDFSEPVGGRDNYSGFEMRVGVSWSFGWGRRVSQLRGLSS